MRTRSPAANAARAPKRRVTTPRNSPRVSGRSSSTPKMSVMKPGVIRKAPPKITSTPSTTSRWGIRPARIVSLKRRQTTRPCDLSSHEPSSESATRIASVGSRPIRSPTLKMTYSSASGTTTKMAISASRGTHPGYPSDVSTIPRMPSVDEVEEALANVIDPELGLDFVELGLVYGIEVDGGEVNIEFTLTSPGCPIGPQVSEQMKEFVGELDGVEQVHPHMTFTPPWTPDRMSEDAKFALGY